MYTYWRRHDGCADTRASRRRRKHRRTDSTRACAGRRCATWLERSGARLSCGRECIVLHCVAVTLRLSRGRGNMQGSCQNGWASFTRFRALAIMCSVLSNMCRVLFIICRALFTFSSLRTSPYMPSYRYKHSHI